MEKGFKLPDVAGSLPDLISRFQQDYSLMLGLWAPSTGTSSVGQTVLYAPDGTGSAAKRGGSGSSGSTTTTTTSPSTSTTGFTINVSWDSSVSSAPSAFTTAVMKAVTYLESTFSDPVTLNISVGWGEVAGATLGSNALGSSQSYLSSYSYSTLTSALSADATSSTDQSAVASLPSTAPVSGNLWVSSSEAKALGLASATSTATDGFVGFSSTLPFTYDNTNGVASGTYDFFGVAVHEITEVMGRLMLTGGTVGSYANSYMLYDLFHYSAPGVRDFSASTAGYFSADGGTTNMGQLNTQSGGDAGDWASSMTNDSFDAFSNSGVVNAVTTGDLAVLDTLGWNLASAAATPTASPTPSPTPSPITAVIAPLTGALGAAQAGSGLAASAVLASVGQSGGASTDSYSYSLGGAGAGSFTLTTSGNTATLATGASGVAGNALYALTVTATDTTTNTQSAAAPFDVIVGTGNGETVSIATLSGSLATSTPTMVFGLAGNDTLNGSGMSGHLWLVGGAGADTMTGGSGGTTYVYGATSDSTASVMDLITNFNSAIDRIDLTGIGTALNYIGKLSNRASSIGAHDIGWTSMKGNTYVYVNTSSSTESLAAIDMKIHLSGSVSLTSGDFIHH